MKKMSLLVVAFVLALPGCGGSRQTKSAQPVRNDNIETHMDAYDNGPEDEDEQDFDFDDIDEDDLGLGEEEEDEVADEEEQYVDEDEDQVGDAFSWIDAQTDDEFKKIYFSFNHYGVRADQKEALAYNIEQIKQLIAESDSVAQATVVIEGHACQEGDPSYNFPLSEKRAKVIADMLVEAGIDKNLIKVVGRGQECPVVADATRVGRAPNRRVEVRVIYT